MFRGMPFLTSFALLLGCEASVPASSPVDAAAPPAPVDAGPADPFADLAARAAVLNRAKDWRALGDAYAAAHRQEPALEAYAKCTENAGDDFETSLYCQAAAAVVRKVKPSPP